MPQASAKEIFLSVKHRENDQNDADNSLPRRRRLGTGYQCQCPKLQCGSNHTRRKAGRSSLPPGASLKGGMCPCGVRPASGTCPLTPRVSFKRGDADRLIAGSHNVRSNKEKHASRAMPNLQLSSLEVALPWRTIRTGGRLVGRLRSQVIWRVSGSGSHGGFR